MDALTMALQALGARYGIPMVDPMSDGPAYGGPLPTGNTTAQIPTVGSALAATPQTGTLGYGTMSRGTADMGGSRPVTMPSAIPERPMGGTPAMRPTGGQVTPDKTLRRIGQPVQSSYAQEG